jgi:glycosyltransferase involved in cell wall biosynthesis
LGTVLDRGNSVRRQKDRTRRWLRSADEVVVVAQWLEEVLVRNGLPPERVTVSRHGLSDDVRSMQEAAAAQRSSPDPDRSLRIGFVGRFTEVKGVHVLVDAVRRLPESVDVAVHLYGVTQSDGDEQYLASLKERARDEPRVRFCGPMTDDNRVEAFAGFDVLAVPSIWKETGPYTVLEAFAADIPVLGSNHSGIRERVADGESGRLVAAGDPDAWARALQELYDRHRSGDWSWTLPAPRTSKDVAREMNALYRRVR